MPWGAIVIATALCAFAGAQAPLTAVEAPTTLSSQILQMSANNEVTLQLAELGEQRGATAAVRRYAQRLKQDASKAAAMLHDKATGIGIRAASLQQQTGPSLAQVLQPLKAASPAAFDRQFLEAMAAQQRQSLARLQQSERQPGSLHSLSHKLAALARLHLRLTEALLQPGAPV